MTRQTLHLFDLCSRISGCSLQQRVNLLINFKQCIGMGIMIGEEFRTILEGCPFYIDLVAEYFGVKYAYTRQLAADRRLTATRCAIVLKANRAKIEAMNDKIGRTAAEAGIDISTPPGTNRLLMAQLTEIIEG